MSFVNRGELVSVALSIAREVSGSPTFAATQESAYGLVDTAVEWFSGFSPRELREEYDGDGAAYRFALPSDWRQDFSAVLRVEYPVQQERAFLAPSQWSLYPSPNGATHLALTSGLIPTSVQAVGVDYIVPHYVLDSAPAVGSPLYTVTTHQGVVQLLLAALIADVWASRTAYTIDPGNDAGEVNFRGKGAEWSAIAKRLIERASAAFGQDLLGDRLAGTRFYRSWGA